MKTPVAVLDPIFENPKDDSGVSTGMVTLTPEDAEAILSRMNFERQRDTDWPHARMLADMMLNNEWAAGSQLTFAFSEVTDEPALVDGQHRLRAAALAGWTGAWNVRVMWPTDVQNVVGLYVLLDGYQKRRTPAVMGRALGFDDLSDRVQTVVIAAAKYQNQWRPSEYSPPGGCSLPPIRDNVARGRKRLDDFRKADRILNMGTTSSKARRRMTTAQVLAIMVETLAVAEDSEAEDFWTGVATNGNGVAGELRDSLIAPKPPRSGAMYTPRLVAGAWNSRTADKLRVPRSGKKLVVEGTALEIPG